MMHPQELRNLTHYRADLLSFLRLTDRPDVAVDRVPSREPGNDFTATLLENGSPTVKSFRVLFKGILGEVEQPSDLKARVTREIRDTNPPDRLLPVCLFVFTMGDDRGYFTWLNEPHPGSPRGLRRRKASAACWRELDGTAMADIVAAVNAWYEAQRQAQAA